MNKEDLGVCPLQMLVTGPRSIVSHLQRTGLSNDHQWYEWWSFQSIRILTSQSVRYNALQRSLWRQIAGPAAASGCGM